MRRWLICGLVAACTSDVHLGSRACDPVSSSCACADTAECPEPFQCIRDQPSGVIGTCTPPANCTIANGQLDCSGQAPSCATMNTCTLNTETCCATDRVCYPSTCLGCCE